MKFSETHNQSAEYLRLAVPMMVKYNIPPNPLNYALWYTYVSKLIPGLNKHLDKALETYGTCPGTIAEELFRKYIIKDEIQGAESFQEDIINLTNSLHDHAGRVAKESASFSNVLEDSLDSLDKAQPVESVIESLSTHTKKMTATTRQFQDRMSEAQAEIMQLKEELNQSRQDARIDPLTKLYNRRIFDVELEILTSTEPSTASAFILIDIDHFKRFNDTYGHLMGDKVLQHVGSLLKTSCSEPAIPVRFGGEEFAILMPETTIEKANALAEEIRKKVQAIRIKQKKSGEVISSVTASFGVSQLTPGETAEEWIERTDQALYQAKEAGRNRVVLAT